MAPPPQGAAISKLHMMDLHAKFFVDNGADVPQSPSRRHVVNSGDRSNLQDCAVSKKKHSALPCALHHHELSGEIFWLLMQRSHSEPRERESSQCLKKGSPSKLPRTIESRLQIIKRYRASWIHRPHCTDNLKYPREVRGNSCDATACQSSVMSQFTS